MKKSIVLCADDYGQAPLISEGIIRLAEKGRLSATSCLINTPYWPEHAAWLMPLQEKIQIGLHLNLTQGQALSSAYETMYGTTFLPLASVLKKACLGQWDVAVIAAEFEAQLTRFVDEMGRLPDFLDGHQHVHQFKGVRDALMQIYLKHFKTKTAFIRLVNEPLTLQDCWRQPKKWIIYLSGTRSLQQLLIKHQIPHNTSFAGIYSFAASASYARYFPTFLQSIQTGGLIMCHPGLKSNRDQPEDEIAASRPFEYDYFMSEQFLKDCAEFDINITKLT